MMSRMSALILLLVRDVAIGVFFGTAPFVARLAFSGFGVAFAFAGALRSLLASPPFSLAAVSLRLVFLAMIGFVLP